MTLRELLKIVNNTNWLKFLNRSRVVTEICGVSFIAYKDIIQKDDSRLFGNLRNSLKRGIW